MHIGNKSSWLRKNKQKKAGLKTKGYRILFKKYSSSVQHTDVLITLWSCAKGTFSVEVIKTDCLFKISQNSRHEFVLLVYIDIITFTAWIRGSTAASDVSVWHDLILIYFSWSHAVEITSGLRDTEILRILRAYQKQMCLTQMCMHNQHKCHK